MPSSAMLQKYAVIAGVALAAVWLVANVAPQRAALAVGVVPNPQSRLRLVA